MQADAFWDGLDGQQQSITKMSISKKIYNPMNNVMGIDIGIANCACAVMESGIEKIKKIDIVTTTPYECVDDRVHAVNQRMEQWIQEYKPTHVYYEDIHFVHSLEPEYKILNENMFHLSYPIGCLMNLTAKYGLTLFPVVATQVKSFITGYGFADKELVRDYLIEKYGYTEVRDKTHHESDAVAIVKAGWFWTKGGLNIGGTRN